MITEQSGGLANGKSITCIQKLSESHDFTESTKKFFQNVCVGEVQMERKAEHDSFSFIFVNWMLFKVSECFTLRAFIPYLKRKS